MEKTLRDYINLIESAEQPVDEGIKSALAGAALAGSMAMNPGVAQADTVPTWQQQVVAAIKDGDLPPVRKIDRVNKQGDWVTSVVINGQEYDISHRLQDPEQFKAAQKLASQHLAQVFREEDQLDEGDDDLDPIAKIDKLFKSS